MKKILTFVLPFVVCLCIPLNVSAISDTTIFHLV